MNTYPIYECFILHFDAGVDANGNNRRCYVLGHPVAGFLAAVDEGAEGSGALRSLRINIQGEASERDFYRELHLRISQRIPIAPAYRKTLLREFGGGRDAAITMD